MIFRPGSRLALSALLSSVVACIGVAACGPEQAENPAYNRDGGPDFAAFGLPCPKAPPDTDGDGISDHNEGADESPPRDTDLDGIPDYRDLDSDGDGIPDAYEGRNGNACTPPADSDGDGIPDFRDVDSDDANDSTLPDRVEAGPNPAAPLDSDGDGLPDFLDPDDDGDGIPDVVEMTAQGGKKPATELARAPDTDGDGIPDYLDVDSDNDNIPDKVERFVDTDGDLIPNYRDTDSDGDCVPDAAEAGDDNRVTDPVDTDGDGVPDYLDLDSDNDGLTDGQEDKNCSGTVDPCETSRIVADTDGDGASDLVEYETCAVKPPEVQLSTHCACDGRDHTVTPLTRGDFVFIVDYNKPPSPDRSIMSLSTDVSQVDLLFALDTTTSMQPALDNIALGVSQIVDQLKVKIADTAYGVFEFRDLGLPQDDPSGSPPNLPAFRYPQRLQTVTGAGFNSLQAALLGLRALGGGDAPESGWAALYTLASTTTRTISVLGSSTYSLFTNAGILPLSMGEAGGTGAGAGFRSGSVPIVVTLSDAEWHDAPGSLVPADGESGKNSYPSVGCNPCTNVPSRREAVTALQGIGAHVIGLASIGAPTFGDPKARAIKLAQETGALVNPGAFGPTGIRPAGCAIDKCCTALDVTDKVVGEATQAGQCPLAFSVNGNDGAGAEDAIVAGVSALTASIRTDVHAEAHDLDVGAVGNFLQQLAPNLTGVGAASLCVTSTPAPLQDKFVGPTAVPGADGLDDTFPGLDGGNLICFDVIPKTNKTVPPTNKPQVFRAQVQVRGVSGTNAVNLGTRHQILFVVPPAIANGPIP